MKRTKAKTHSTKIKKIMMTEILRNTQLGNITTLQTIMCAVQKLSDTC